LTPTSIIPTKFEVDMTVHCRVIAFLSADTSRDFVTLTSDLSTLNNCCVWRVTCPTLLPSLKTVRLSLLDLWVITFPVGYHWECVRGHCACAESRDPWVGGQKQWHFWNPRPWFTYSLCTFGGSTMKVIKVICENNALPCVKRPMSFCACEIAWSVKGNLNVLLRSFSLTSIYLLDFKSSAYSRIFGHFQQHLYCACAETVIYTTVRFPDPDFLVVCKILAIWRRFPLIIAFYILNVRHISTSGLFDLRT